MPTDEDRPRITEIDADHIGVPTQDGGLEILSRTHSRVVRVRAHTGGKPICQAWVEGAGEIACAVSAMELLAAMAERPAESKPSRAVKG